MSDRFRFEGEELAEAIRRTFERRRTPLPTEAPLALTEAFAGNERKQRQWRAFVRRGRLQATGKHSLEEVVQAIRPFLMRAAEAAAREKAFEQIWPPGGPWREAM